MPFKFNGCPPEPIAVAPLVIISPPTVRSPVISDEPTVKPKSALFPLARTSLRVWSSVSLEIGVKPKAPVMSPLVTSVMYGLAAGGLSLKVYGPIDQASPVPSWP